MKGEDEIRQDAVMSQVFAQVNRMMVRRGRGNNSVLNMSAKLRLIRYNVIPLSPSSGVRLDELG